MDNIVEELIRIESMADQYMADSEKERMEVTARTRAQIRVIKETLEAETREKVRELHAAASGETQAALREISHMREVKMQKLEHDFAENRAAWETEIVNRILYPESADL